ncbi:hypothetical protein SNEBB_010463 [Seison nebaliae]|nr:hypothetical protein SNEBB_010463 [Seison nebaliae]
MFNSLDILSKLKENNVVKFIFKYFHSITLVLTPILFSPLLIVHNEKLYRTCYVTAIVAIFWLTRALPLSVTGLLPAALVPLLGIMSSRDLAAFYMKDVTLLFLGGLSLAAVIQKWNLHYRIALSVLKLVGLRPPALLFGFMSATAFLSMWISNTATAAMMIPIAVAVLQQLKPNKTHVNFNEAFEVSDEEMNETTSIESNQLSKNMSVAVTEMVEENVRTNIDTQVKEWRNLGKALSLSIAYSASIGGSMTIIGTGPNTVLKGEIDKNFPSNDLGFLKFMLYSVPVALVLLLITWFVLIQMFLPNSLKLKKNSLKDVNIKQYRTESEKVINRKYENLGPMNWPEYWVAILFIFVIILWFFRDPQFVPGWAAIFPVDENGNSYMSDTTPVIIVVILTFIIPAKPPKFLRKTTINTIQDDEEDEEESKKLMSWSFLEKNVPWGIIFLLGGGFIIAEASKRSGLTKAIGDILEANSTEQYQTLYLFVLILCVGLATEVTSNVAISSISIPIMLEIARREKISPLFYALPSTLASSLAFMFPVATPPNAIVYSYGYISLPDMVRTGVILNLVGYVIILIGNKTIGIWVMDIQHVPSWATNVTHSEAFASAFATANTT